jgi:hypothetical protein
MNAVASSPMTRSAEAWIGLTGESGTARLKDMVLQLRAHDEAVEPSQSQGESSAATDAQGCAANAAVSGAAKTTAAHTTSMTRLKSIALS